MKSSSAYEVRGHTFQKTDNRGQRSDLSSDWKNFSNSYTLFSVLCLFEECPLLKVTKSNYEDGAYG